MTWSLNAIGNCPDEATEAALIVTLREAFAVHDGTSYAVLWSQHHGQVDLVAAPERT